MKSRMSAALPRLWGTHQRTPVCCLGSSGLGTYAISGRMGLKKTKQNHKVDFSILPKQLTRAEGRISRRTPFSNSLPRHYMVRSRVWEKQVFFFAQPPFSLLVWGPNLTRPWMMNPSNPTNLQPGCTALSLLNLSFHLSNRWRVAKTSLAVIKIATTPTIFLSD